MPPADTAEKGQHVRRAGAGRPQSLIRDRLLDRSELLVVIFGDGLGSPASFGSSETAAQEELRIGLDLVRRGHADDVFLYFRRREGQADGRAVTAFKEQVQLSKQLFSWDFVDAADLSNLVSRHVREWLRKWERVPDICDVMLCDVSADPESLGENRLARLAPRSWIDRSPLPFLGRLAVDCYQRFGPKGAEQVFQLPAADNVELNHWAIERSIAPVVGAPLPRLKFASREWFQYFCARGLIDAILRNEYSAVEDVPYENPIHQYLAALAPAQAPALTKNLVSWLNGAGGNTVSRPIVRNFAAYVLGMIGAIDAQDDLARALQDDEGENVRIYCVTSLGKLRCRRHLDLLVDQYGSETDARLRYVLGQAICRIVGIARFEL